MITTSKTAIIIILTACSIHAAEYHVSPNGLDSYQGSAQKPLLTIQAAAELAMPGDTITVHEGIYRERVNPPRGGTSAEKRIVYQAAPGEKVMITGAEIVTGWEDLGSGLWRVDIDRDFFGSFNPFADEISGHWYRVEDRTNHSGTVYINGTWLEEAATEQGVRGTVPESGPLWWAEVNETTGQIRVLVQYKGADLNLQHKEGWSALMIASRVHGTLNTSLGSISWASFPT